MARSNRDEMGCRRSGGGGVEVQEMDEDCGVGRAVW